MTIPMFSSYISPKAEDYVARVLRSGMLSEGKLVAEFEREFEKTFNLREGSFLAVNSGTSALHLALEVLELGGEVILPANTFVATGMAILMAGCKPVFADILPDGTIDPEDVERKITRQTIAVIGVNWAGKRCQVMDLEEICARLDLFLIIDAAQSLGVQVGGDITCFSFQATKHLTTGDGGGIWFKNPVLYETAKKLRWFGISKDAPVGLLGEREYDLGRVGYKYHMNDYAAALGLANLEGIIDRLVGYREKAWFYEKHLVSVVPIELNFFWNHAFWAFPIRVDSVSRFSDFCRGRDIPCSNIHRGIDRNLIFGGRKNGLFEQGKWEVSVTHLPIHMGMSLEDVKWICDEVNQYV